MEEKKEIIPANIETIKDMVYVIRGQQVMIDSDLARLYGYEVRALNQQVKRNKGRFPEDFVFQLTEKEIPPCLKSQIVTLNESGNKRGQHIKKLPHAFTEQGIYMLATVLRGELAEKQSIYIMRAFKEMRHFIAANAVMLDRIKSVELKQLEYQKETNEKFDQIFEYIFAHEESSQKIFYAGQIFDAFSLLSSIVKQASERIILIDNYVDIGTLNILAKKNAGVATEIYTSSASRLSNEEVELFNTQYPTLTVNYTSNFHDRFLIIDKQMMYHIGASLKDAGKKCFGINKIESRQLVEEIINAI